MPICNFYRGLGKRRKRVQELSSSCNYGCHVSYITKKLSSTLEGSDECGRGISLRGHVACFVTVPH
jgi:hypothetical protein